jgi:transposase IS200 family protein
MFERDTCNLRLNARLENGAPEYAANNPRANSSTLFSDAASKRADHVHLIVTPPRTLSQAELVESLKKKSFKWINELAHEHGKFYWQRGYGAFSVSPSQLNAVIKYVETQEEHHRSRTFQEEYPEFLRKHDVHYDERYVWDEGTTV